MSDGLDVTRIATDSAMAVLIWLVQLIIYPAFHSIESARFTEWHRKYMKTISIFVIPLMLMQAGCIGLQLREKPDAATLAAAGSVLLAWLITFGISAPCHRQLQHEGKDETVIRRLISTNWLRTACWSLTWLLGHFGTA